MPERWELFVIWVLILRHSEGVKTRAGHLKWYIFTAAARWSDTQSEWQLCAVDLSYVKV